MFYIILFSSFDNLFVTFSSTKARRILLFVTLIDLTHIFCYKSVPSYLRLKKNNLRNLILVEYYNIFFNIAC